MNEQWKPVSGYEGWYEVSNAGRLRRIVSGKGTRPMLIHKNRLCPNGYNVARLHRDGEAWYIKMHILVLQTFVGPKPQSSSQCNHINGDKADNRVENLEWCSPVENSHHRFDVLGHGVKLTPATVSGIRKALAIGRRGCDIAKDFGISRATVTNIKTGKTWGRVAC